jgi:hypothetical protein
MPRPPRGASATTRSRSSPCPVVAVGGFFLPPPGATRCRKPPRRNLESLAAKPLQSAPPKRLTSSNHTAPNRAPRPSPQTTTSAEAPAASEGGGPRPWDSTAERRRGNPKATATAPRQRAPHRPHNRPATRPPPRRMTNARRGGRSTGRDPPPRSKNHLPCGKQAFQPGPPLPANRLPHPKGKPPNRPTPGTDTRSRAGKSLLNQSLGRNKKDPKNRKKRCKTNALLNNPQTIYAQLCAPAATVSGSPLALLHML